MKAKELKKRAIMRVAMELFSKYPYHQVAMDDIARYAKVAKGTLYYHFKSKEALYASLLYDGVDKLLSCLREKFKEGDVVENIKLFVTELTKFFHEKRSFFLVLQKEESKVLDKKLSNCYKRFCTVKDILKSFIEDGQNKGLIRNDINSSIVTELIMGMIKNPITNTKIEPEEHAKAIVSLLEEGLLNK